MAGTAVLLNGGTNSMSTASQTRYAVPGGAPVNAAGTTNETISSYTDRSSPGALHNFYTTVKTNTRSDATSIQARLNGSDTLLAVSPASSATGQFSDLTDSVTLASGDVFSLATTTGGGTGAITLQNYAAQFDYTGSGGGWFSMATNNAGHGVTGYSATIGQGVAVGGIRAAIQESVYSAGTLRRFAVGVSANSLNSGNAVFTQGINQANVTQTVTFGFGVTGYSEDTINSDSITAGQTVDNQCVAGGTSGLITYQITVTFDPTTAGEHTTGFAGVITKSAGTATQYQFFAGGLGGSAGGGTTEANVQNVIPAACTVSNCATVVQTNTLTAASSLTLRKNGVSQSPVITITSGITGTFANTTDSATFAVGDLAGWMQTIGATGTSLTINAITAKIAVAAVVAASRAATLAMMGCG